MSERTNDPERIYLEPPPYSPEGRQWCADDVWPLDGDGPGGVEYVRADLAALRSEAQGEAFTPDMVEAVRFASGLFAAGEWGPVLARTAERMEALRGKGAE